MTIPTTSLDLDAIAAKGWVYREDFTDAEFQSAAEFYAAMRVDDARLHEVRAEAARLIEEWTGHASRDVGSFGIRLNLETSDLDLGIGYPVEDRPRLMQAMDGRATFLGERNTSFSTTRLVFSFTVQGVEIDLSALTVDDFQVSCRLLDQIEDAMTEDDRICHTWVKQLLRAQHRLDEYAAWKLVTYRRFCPEFNWVPIKEKAAR